MGKKTHHLFFTLAVGLLFFFGIGPYMALLASKITTPYITANIPFLTLAVGVLLAQRIILQEPLRDLFTEERPWNWNHASIIGLSYLGGIIILTLISAAVHPEEYHRFHAPLKERILFIILALILTPIQTTGEELLFRIIPLTISKKISNKVIRSLIPTIIFTLLHLANREIAHAQNNIAVLLYYALFGFLPSYIALKEETYEFPIAIHAANNLFVAIFCNYEFSSLPSTPFFISSTPIGTWGDLTQFTVLLSASYALLKLGQMVRNRSKRLSRESKKKNEK